MKCRIRQILQHESKVVHNRRRPYKQVLIVQALPLQLHTQIPENLRGSGDSSGEGVPMHTAPRGRPRETDVQMHTGPRDGHSWLRTSEPTRAQHQQYDTTREEVAAPSSNENHTLQQKKTRTRPSSPLGTFQLTRVLS